MIEVAGCFAPLDMTEPLVETSCRDREVKLLT
jgi:hypothetical protein